jgi:2-oxoglutarate dehydrogenase E2 component (dihydrolipoamide succinyltransferase)
MSVEVRVPQLPESVADAMLVAWHKKIGQPVSRDELLADLETDKVTLEVPAPSSGVLRAINVKAGSSVKSSELLAVIDESVTAAVVRPSVTGDGKVAAVKSARGKDAGVWKAGAVSGVGRVDRRIPMTRLRARIAERLVQAQSTQALLTTFNEVDLTAVQELRTRYKDSFEKKHGVKLGFMSFFVKSTLEGLKRVPVINASVQDGDVVYHEYFDIGVAVSTVRGLMVPVLRDVDGLSFADIEKGIANYAARAREGSIALEELSGGTFSITNGGTFGSLMSTPIVNAPQSAILGLHKVQERPMVVHGQIRVRSMMYLAVTYDHRIIDGREAVQFLVAIKDGLEDPGRLLLGV